MRPTGVRAAVLICGAALVLLVPRQAHAEDERDRQPKVIDAEDVSHRPSGYRTETRARRGAIITGGIMTGVGGLMILAGLDAKSNSGGMGNGPGSGGELLYIPGAVVAGIGLPILIYGLLSPRRVYVRESEPHLALAVSPRRDAGAVTLSFRF